MAKTPLSFRFSTEFIQQVADLQDWLPADNATQAIEKAVNMVHAQLKGAPVTMSIFKSMVDAALGNWMFEQGNEEHQEIKAGLEQMQQNPPPPSTVEAHVQDREDWNGLEALARFFGQK